MHENRSSRSGLGVILLVLALVGAAVLTFLVRSEDTRARDEWRARLDLVADTAARDVTQWVQRQFQELGALADNASLQIYFLELKASAEKPNAAPAGQADYLRNLLTLTAERLGFSPKPDAVAAEIQANVNRLATGGLALVDLDGNVLNATTGMPPLAGKLLLQVKDAPRGQSTLLDMEPSEDGTPRIGFIVPIYAIQSEHDAASQIGMIVGVRAVDASLYGLLKPQALQEKTLEVALVRPEENTVRFLSPLMDGSPLLSRHEDNLPGNYAAAGAIAAPRNFARGTDYRGEAVLYTGRAISATPWTLIAKIDESEALAAAIARRNHLLVIFALLLSATAATFAAVWRTAAARKAAELAEDAQDAAEAAEAQATLLSLVTDTQTEALYILDPAHQVWFANRQAEMLMQAPLSELSGKPLAHTIGGAIAAPVTALADKAMESHSRQQVTLTRSDGEITRTLNVQAMPLSRIPIEDAAAGTGALIVEQDISEVVAEREKRLQTLDQLIAVLVSLMDRRDPHAAKHSNYVAKVAAATARGMGLDPMMAETAEIAAKLINIGKMDVPAELLTRKMGGLSDAERNLIRDSLTASADLIDGIAFIGPVSDTLRQAQEHVDGSGPLKLAGDAILVTARILAAANALVGMLSPRAYRDALSCDEAAKLLMGKMDTQFDRRVVVALLHYLDNGGGREELATLTQPFTRKSA